MFHGLAAYALTLMWLQTRPGLGFVVASSVAPMLISCDYTLHCTVGLINLQWKVYFNIL